MNNQRNYGIDLLRMVLMFMVCILHALGQGGILDAAAPGTMQYGAFWALEIFSYCAVDGFAFISGYMAEDKPLRYEKIIKMWFQAFFYSFVVTLILTVAGINENWEASEMIRCGLPITFNKFWYFTGFFVLFLAIPILNKFIFAINISTAKKVFMVCVVVFSCIGFFKDPFNMAGGCSAIWLMVLYCLGALSKRIGLFEKKKSVTLVILWGLCLIVTWIALIYLHNARLIKYTSPTILLSGIIMVILFSRIRLKGTIISKLTPFVFGIYLLQLNQVIWDDIIKNAFAFVAAKQTVIGILYVFAIAFGIFIVGLVVEIIRCSLANLLRIPSLSKKIVEFVNKILIKASAVLK